jgi:hypothetical protein
MSELRGQRVSFICEYCGIEFTELESHVRLGRVTGRYCSRAHYHAHQAPEQRCGACGTACVVCAQQRRQAQRAARAARDVEPGQHVCQACGKAFAAPYTNHGRERRFCSDCWANRAAYAYRQRQTLSPDLARRNQRIIELRDAGNSAPQILELLKGEWPALGSQTVYKVTNQHRHRPADDGYAF